MAIAAPIQPKATGVSHVGTSCPERTCVRACEIRTQTVGEKDRRRVHISDRQSEAAGHRGGVCALRAAGGASQSHALPAGSATVTLTGRGGLMLSSTEERTVRDWSRLAWATIVAVALVAVGLSMVHPPAATADGFTFNAEIGPGYCQNKKMTFDYSVENVDRPGPATVQLLENGTTVLELSVPQGSIVTGAYSTNLPIGSAITLQFRTDGVDIGFERPTLVKNCLPPPRDFEPTVPTFNDLEGGQNDSVTIPAYEGVDYAINGQLVSAGVWPAQGKVTVLARVAAGYVFNGPQQMEWTYTFVGDNVPPPPTYTFPTPTVTFEKYRARKVVKSDRRYCARLIRMRDDDYDGRRLTKRQYKTLGTKCKLPFPRIQYSTRTTKVYEGIPYNWGVRPLTAGRSRVGIDRMKMLAFPSDLSVVEPDILEYVFDRAGNVQGRREIGTIEFGGYFATRRLYTGGRLQVDRSVDQGKPYNKNPKQVVDSQIVQRFCNRANTATTVTVGIKTHRRNPEIIVEDTFDLGGGECRTAVVSDSAGLPLTGDEQLAPDDYRQRNFVHINPDKTTSLKYRSEAKGIYYFRVNSGSAEGAYYQRSLLIGTSTLRSGETKPTLDFRPTRSTKKDMFRGW